MNFSRILEYLNSIFTGFISKPSVLVIELNNNCNANCKMCGHDEMPRKKMQMDYDLFKKIILNAKKCDIKNFQLSFYGEPLLYPKLVESVKYIKDNVVDSVVQISTNASLLEKSISKQLLSAGLDRFLVSIDGNNAKEFNQIRLGLNWDNVKKNIVDLHNLITKHRYSAQIFFRGLNLKGLPINKAQYLKEWGNFATKVHIRNTHELNRLTNEKFAHKLLPCELLFSQHVILVDGSVTICNQDWDGCMSYANVHNQSIKQLWFDPVLIKMRFLHILGMKKTISFCRNCAHRVF